MICSDLSDASRCGLQKQTGARFAMTLLLLKTTRPMASSDIDGTVSIDGEEERIILSPGHWRAAHIELSGTDAIILQIQLRRAM